MNDPQSAVVLLFRRNCAAQIRKVPLMSIPFSSGSTPEPKKENRLLLSMQMILDEIEDALPSCYAQNITDRPFLRTVMAYYSGMTMSGDCLYWLPPGEGDSFPSDTYAFVSSHPRTGKAPHIIVQGISGVSLLDLLLRIFQKYRDFEAALNLLVAGGGDLDDLCRLGASFFHNPMYIHDQYFSILARPFRIEGQLRLEYNERTGRYNIPLSLIEDFKFNEQYRETLGKRHADIWGTEQVPLGMRSLYVNLFDGDLYLGRLLINELQTPLTKGQLKLAEYLASHIVYILRRRDRTGSHYRSHEETMRLYLTQGTADVTDLSVLMFSLDWNASDSFLCIVMKSQLEDTAITSENILRGKITAMLHGISFFHEDDLCIVLNMSSQGYTLPQVHHLLAPLMRDSLMYCGLSNPVRSFAGLPYGYLQARAALEYITRWKDSRWMLQFEQCALEYIGEHIDRTLPSQYLVSYRLQLLKDHDRRHGSDYYQTLYTYLLNERNIPRTSEQLIIHRTTLLYRLEKIREITSFHLDDPDERLYLLISFRSMDRK